MGNEPKTLQDRFQEALKEPPLDLLDRLDREGDELIWVMGTALERFGRSLRRDEKGFRKMFLCDPGMDDETRKSLEVSDGPEQEGQTVTCFRSNCLERLDSFPNGTFDVTVSAWMIGTVPGDELLPVLRNVLSENGKSAFVSMKDGTPEQPIDLMCDSIRKVTGRTTDLENRGFLSDAGSFRSLLRKNGFRQERAWDGSVSVSFSSPEEVFELMKKSIGAGLSDLDPDKRRNIKTEFCERVRDQLGDTPEITYQYIGAIGLC